MPSSNELYVLSLSRLNRCHNKRYAFPNSAGFLPARLALGISVSFSKTGALEVSASLIANWSQGFNPRPPRFHVLVPRPNGPPVMNSVHTLRVSMAFMSLILSLFFKAVQQL